MLSDNSEPNWSARITLLALVLAAVGGLWLLNQANGGTEPPTAVATTCSAFEADARKLFDQGDSAALSGTFAPGDHVHLAIDFEGVGYAWELTGVIATKPDVTGSGWWTTVTKRTTSTASSSTPSTEAHGDISGFVKFELELDVATAGDGAITINKTGSVPSLSPPTVASASCNSSTPADDIAEIKAVSSS